MSRTASSSTEKIYGLARVCKIWKMARSTVYWRKTHAPSRARRGPRPWHSDSELLAAIRAFIAGSEFVGEGYRKVHAALRFHGLRTSPRRVLRLMRENNLLAPGRVGQARGPKTHDGHIKTERLNDMWGTDMTTTLTRDEGTASIFFAIDHCSLEVVGIHAAKRGTRFEALEPLRQGVVDHFGSLSEKAAQGLTLRHDHGSQFISGTYQKELRFLGIKSSPSFVRQPQGNGIAERFVRTLKENLLWVGRFATVEDLRLALLNFKDSYNHKWMVGRHGYKTPAQVRDALNMPLPMAA